MKLKSHMTRRWMRLLWGCLLLLSTAWPASAQLGTPMPSPIFTGLDASGVPCGSCKLYAFVTGSTTPLGTFTDAALTTPSAHPIVLNSAGRATVYLTPGLTYRFRLDSAADTTLWTVDGVASLQGIARDRLRISPHTATVAAGAFTAIYSQYDIDTEGAAATDDLDTITLGTGLGEGSLLVLAPANVAHVVTVRDSVGNIKLAGGNFPLDSVKKTLTLYYDGGSWVELARAGGQTYLQTSAVGTQNNFNPGIIGTTVLRAANATDLTITGFLAGIDGQRLTVIADGVGLVNFAYSSGSSTAGNRIITPSAGTISIAGGSGSAEFVYEASLAAWRMVSFEQGAWLRYSPIWGNTGTINTGGGALEVGEYYRSGRAVHYRFSITFATTTGVGSGTWTFAYPFTLVTTHVATSLAYGASGSVHCLAFDNSAGTYYPVTSIESASTTTFLLATAASPEVGVSATVPFTWANLDSMSCTGTMQTAN